MRLPADSIIATSKLREYLLIPKARNDKSRWLGHAGYLLENWLQLERDLRQQILTLDAEFDGRNSFGEVFRIRGTMIGPNGRALRVVTIWMMEHSTGLTKFITMYPDRQ
jgi:hypothetical protein